MNRVTRVLCIFTFGLSLIGCQHNDPVAQQPLTAPMAAPLAGGRLPAAIQEFTLASIRIDPETLAATVTPMRNRTTQSPQGQLFDIDLAQFFSPSNFGVKSVRRDKFGDLEIETFVQHPFPAPDFTQPPSAKNRADLGFTGRLMILADRVHQGLPQGLTVDSKLVREPDGYAKVGDLLRNQATVTNNLFPFFQVVDEDFDPREGVSNGGNREGNFNPFAGGWQRSNIGPTNNGWTGYGYLHQGQRAAQFFSLDESELGVANWEFAVALMGFYVRPTAHPGVEDRLPAETPNVANFAYRAVYAAVDAPQVFACEDHFMRTRVGTGYTTLDLALEEYDNLAEESLDADLSDEPDVSKVQPGASGPPEVAVIMPDLNPAEVILPNVGGTGTTADPLRYETLFENASGAPEGDYWGLLEITDPENDDPDRDTYHFGVDPETLAADPARALDAVTYVPLQFHVYPEANSWLMSYGEDDFDEAFRAVQDSEGNVYVAQKINTEANDFEPGDCRYSIPIGIDGSFALTKYDPNGDRVWTEYGGGDHGDYIADMDIDSDDQLIIDFVISSIGVDIGLRGGVVTVSATDPLFGRHVVATYDLNVEPLWHADLFEGEASDYISIAEMQPITAGKVGIAGQLKGTVDLDPGVGVDEHTSEGLTDAYVMVLDEDGNWEYSAVWDGDGPGLESANSFIVIPGGSVLKVCGTLSAPAGGVPFDLDPGAGTDMHTGSATGTPFLASLDGANGDYIDGVTWFDDTASGSCWRVTTMDDGSTVIIGNFRGTGDFDPGPGMQPMTAGFSGDTFIASYNSSNAYQWAYAYAGMGSLGASSTYLWSYGTSIYLAGRYLGSTDFDPGPGVMTAGAGTGSFFSQYFTSLKDDGSFRFVKSWDGNINGPFINDFRPTPNWRLLLAGQAIDGMDLDLGAGTLPMEANGSADALVMEMSADGEFD